MIYFFLSQDPELTFGQMYCDILRSRQILFNEYINTEIRSFKRAPFCYFPPSVSPLT